jgi:hypothetical protein
MPMLSIRVLCLAEWEPLHTLIEKLERSHASSASHLEYIQGSHLGVSR